MTYGYICRYKGKEIEIRNDGGTIKARNEAAKVFKVKPGKEWQIYVVLAEKDGEPVIHTAT